MDPKLHHYGVNLVDEGMDSFKSKINIEVQHASEQVIAAVERHGGSITTAYFDMKSVMALHNPAKFFESGKGLAFMAFLINLINFNHFSLQDNPFRKENFQPKMHSSTTATRRTEGTLPTLPKSKWSGSYWRKNTATSCPK